MDNLHLESIITPVEAELIQETNLNAHLTHSTSTQYSLLNNNLFIYLLFTPPKKPVSIYQRECGQLHQQKVQYCYKSLS
jgi:hypothetical protein